MSRDFRNRNPEDQPGTDSTSSEELEWLAFRYVSDEMPETERAEFEKRLEADTEAQSALVDVMRSTQLIYAALDSAKSKVGLADRSDANTKSAVQRYSAVLAAAAAILLMVCGWAIYNGSQNGPGVAVNNSQNSADLAVAWADSLTAHDLVAIEAELDELADEVEFDDFVASSDDSLGESEGWMYVALVEMEKLAEVSE